MNSVYIMALYIALSQQFLANTVKLLYLMEAPLMPK